MIVGISCVVFSKYQLGLSPWPLSTHGTCGAATIAALTVSVARNAILPSLYPASELESLANGRTSRVLAIGVFVCAYVTAYLGVRELYDGHVWSGGSIALFFVLTISSLVTEALSFLLDRL